MPVYGTYDDTFRENLKPYIEHLNMASGTINCPEAFALAQKLKEENADFARMSQDRVYENLSFRANVIAYLKACVLYVANGCQWESEIEEFVRWSEQYDRPVLQDEILPRCYREGGAGGSEVEQKRAFQYAATSAK